MLLVTRNPRTDHYQVHFAAHGSVRYTVNLQRKPSDLPVHASCGKPQKKPLCRYHLLGIGRN